MDPEPDRSGSNAITPIVKSNAGRKKGTKSKPGSLKPGPKPKHLKNQQRLLQFLSPQIPTIGNISESSTTTTAEIVATIETSLSSVETSTSILNTNTNGDIEHKEVQIFVKNRYRHVFVSLLIFC